MRALSLVCLLAAGCAQTANEPAQPVKFPAPTCELAAQTLNAVAIERKLLEAALPLASPEQKQLIVAKLIGLEILVEGVERWQQANNCLPV